MDWVLCSPLQDVSQIFAQRARGWVSRRDASSCMKEWRSSGLRSILWRSFGDFRQLISLLCDLGTSAMKQRVDNVPELWGLYSSLFVLRSLASGIKEKYKRWEFFLDEQKHAGGRDRVLCTVTHTEEHCNCFLHVPFLSQAGTCYRFYQQSCHIVIQPLGLYVLNNLVFFPYPLSRRCRSHTGAGSAFYILPCSPVPWAAGWAFSNPHSPLGSWKMVRLNASPAASPHYQLLRQV